MTFMSPPSALRYDFRIMPQAVVSSAFPYPDEWGEAAPPESKAKKILVVDDNDDFRENLRVMLSARGYDVLGAVDGRHGLELVAEEIPDLVLTDFNMPRLNGFEMIRDLRGRPETIPLPIILFTGARHRRVLQDLDTGPCTLLEKPLSNELLLASIEAYLGPAPKPSPDAGWFPSEERQLAQEADAAPAPRELQVEPARPEPEEAARLDDAADSPLVEQINRLLIRAVGMGASDVHFEPQAREVAVRARVDGALRRIGSIPNSYRARLVARIKIMANLIITEHRLPQDGQFRALFRGRQLDIRVSTLPSQHGENVVMRLFGTGGLKQGMGALGLTPRDREHVDWAMKSAHGLILVTGPTGSGKSTTLYTMVGELNTPSVSIMTAEDPVERAIPGVTQVPVRASVGLTFAAIMRSFLRQDPDVMLIGEIRDLETADIAVNASITGHLVLSTLHTNSAPAAVTRLAHMGVAPYLTASSARLVVAQRLVRLLCPSCRVLSTAPEEELRLLPDNWRQRLARSHRPYGCSACQGTGFQGRMPLFEVMPIRTVRMRAKILAGEAASAIATVARDEGMRTLPEAAVEAVASGATSLSEALDLMLTD